MKKDTSNAARRDDEAAEERLLKSYKKNILREPLPEEIEEILPGEGAAGAEKSRRRDI